MLIGVCGKAGSGKDTLANFLVENHCFTRLAFADALRAAALAIDPIVSESDDGEPLRLSEFIREPSDWDWAKREIPEIRRLLQVIGTEVGREILGENVWVDLVDRQIKDGKNYVITDVRFDNEVDYVRSKGGTIVQIVRLNNPNAIAGTHASEQLQVKPDYIVHNDGDFGVLASNAHALVGWVRYINNQPRFTVRPLEQAATVGEFL
jgi:hypothetical protein